ncbi:hypothetical protein GTO87_02930 [Ligilactobacillus saerimneri]|uniref:Uncharacterized protein n=1 Tax=Ligilactobacillus saerimneri TaxID=228229 RepID=A0A7H9EKE2_9LACO|nr:hypothetical protein [Ligilactobacillus saerimneri]QLL77645.1 hypothetical protein GTO87_02930 [Ligilactobacillus saerimneri]
MGKEAKTFRTWYLLDNWGNLINGTEDFNKVCKEYNPVEDDYSVDFVFELMEEDEQDNTRIHYFDY